VITGIEALLNKKAFFESKPAEPVAEKLRRRSFARDTKAPTFGFELEGGPFLVRHASPRRQGTAPGFHAPSAQSTHEESTSGLKPLTCRSWFK
jgi:hypothetical protein